MKLMKTANKNVSFSLGSVVATPGALEALASAGKTPVEFLARHAGGDWGDLDAEDAKMNDRGVEGGDRLLSSYKLPGGGKLWVITEWDRSATTLLLPSEY